MITLENVNVIPSQSQESVYFDAKVIKDGQLVGVVKNNGRGGPNVLTPVQGKSYQDIKDIDSEDMINDMLYKLFV